MRILLISTYELGRQPFGLASPAAWLRRAGFEVECADTTRHKLSQASVSDADAIAFYLPMHTATRIAVPIIDRVRQKNPTVRLAAYGLYAPLNEQLLREHGVELVAGGEFEQAIVDWAQQLRTAAKTSSESGTENRNSKMGKVRRAASVTPHSPSVSLDRLQFITPDRGSLPPLKQYARLAMPDGRELVCGYTEASRGCKHLCRHCPIVPVYEGKFRVVQQEVVLADIRQQVEAGAQHITFGDPDFFNGPAHALAIVRALHREWPCLSYDVTIKIEHLLRHADDVAVLRDSGCAFVTSAVESVDDRVLALLAKGHTRADFVAVANHFREMGLALAPTFVAFTPWTSMESYLDLLKTVADLGLIDSVPPVQWTLRLLVTSGSPLLQLPEMREHLRGFDAGRLCHRWVHPDPRVDALQQSVDAAVQELTVRKFGRQEIFEQVLALTRSAIEGGEEVSLPEVPILADRATVPYLTEPWYC